MSRSAVPFRIIFGLAIKNREEKALSIWAEPSCFLLFFYLPLSISAPGAKHQATDAAPSVFVTTSSNWQKPRSVKKLHKFPTSCYGKCRIHTVPPISEETAPAAGSNTPNGRNIRIFSTKYRSGRHWFPRFQTASNPHRFSNPVLSKKQCNRNQHGKIDGYQKPRQSCPPCSARYCSSRFRFFWIC